MTRGYVRLSMLLFSLTQPVAHSKIMISLAFARL